LLVEFQMMKTLIALATGLALIAAPAAAAPVSNVGGAKAVAASSALPVTTVQSRGKRVAPIGGPYRGGRPHGGGWHHGGRYHHGGRDWYGGRGWYGWGWGGGWGYWPGYYGGYYGDGYYGGYYGRPVVVAPGVATTRVVKVRRPWTKAWYRYCAKRYRSFNPRTGYYRTYRGRLVFCR
jgi:hypothetical protein